MEERQNMAREDHSPITTAEQETLVSQVNRCPFFQQ
jgi:hypothetical protein